MWKYIKKRNPRGLVEGKEGKGGKKRIRSVRDECIKGSAVTYSSAA